MLLTSGPCAPVGGLMWACTSPVAALRNKHKDRQVVVFLYKVINGRIYDLLEVMTLHCWEEKINGEGKGTKLSE